MMCFYAEHICAQWLENVCTYVHVHICAQWLWYIFYEKSVPLVMGLRAWM